MDRSRVGSPACLLPALLLLAVPGGLSIHGPQGVSGPAGGLVTIRCRYGLGWEDYVKWWCRGQHWGSCNILVSTTGTEQKRKTGRVSIQDDQARREVKVTMEELRTEDEDFYWCGIQKSGTDLGHLVHVSVYAASTHPPEPEGRFTTPAVTHTNPPVTTDATTPGMTEALSLESAEAPEANTSAVPEPPFTTPTVTHTTPPVTTDATTPGMTEALSLESAEAPEANTSAVPEPQFTTPTVTHTTPPVTTDATTPGMTEALSLESAEAPEANTSAVPEPPDTWSADNSSLPLSGRLTWALVCNMHFLLLTFMKVPLLWGLLCAVMWLNRSQGDFRGE